MISCYFALLSIVVILIYGKNLPLWVSILVLAVHIISFINVCMYDTYVRNAIKDIIRGYLKK